MLIVEIFEQFLLLSQLSFRSLVKPNTSGKKEEMEITDWGIPATDATFIP